MSNAPRPFDASEASAPRVVPFAPSVCAVSVITLTSGGREQVAEVAAVRFQDGEKGETFSRLASIEGPVPLAFTQITGLDEGRLRGHPAADMVLEGLVEFVGKEPVLVHDAGRFDAVLEREGVAAPGAVFDTRLLARVALPSQEDYSPGALAAALDLEREEKHRALNDALLTHDLWGGLLRTLATVRPEVIRQIVRLLGACQSPYRAVFQAVAGPEAGFMEAPPEHTFAEVFQDNTRLLKQARGAADRAMTDEHVNLGDVAALFTRNGAIGRTLEGYERRPHQQEMARHVCRAFNDGTHLLVEAGTGIGKSLAYLAPAILWTQKNQDRVLVSTNTKNLQAQLHDKDVPLLARAIEEPFHAALVKGRTNYLCIRKLLGLLAEHERELAGEEEYLALLPVLTWAARTESGDAAECNGLLSGPLAPVLWDRLASSTAECPGSHCDHANRCFFRKNRALAWMADIIIANHSVVFANLGIEGALPPCRCIVFDEGHNVEDVATDFFARGFDRFRVWRIASRLHRVGRGRRAVGLLPRLMLTLERELAGSPAVLERINLHFQDALKQIDAIFTALDHLFDACDAAFRGASRFEDKRRFHECGDTFTPESEVTRAFGAFREEVKRLQRTLDKLAEMAGGAPEFPGKAPLVRDVGAYAQELAALADDVAFIAAHEEEDYVYWIERVVRDERYTNYAFTAAPVTVAPLIHQNFFEPRRTVILCSATLTVGGGFEFMAERVGAALVEPERVTMVDVGTPFDYESQCLLAVPTFLPPPTGGRGGRHTVGFDEALASFLVELMAATEGRALVLFTSWSLLDHTYQAVKPALEERGIPVLGQGRDGTREAITSMFRAIRSSVLLGTQSFWEGVDVAGETLSCLVVTKLPFQVFTEPLVQARAEYLEAHGRDAFLDYSLPTAVIRLRQGFGRLIRTRTDRGVVVVTDRRLVEKRYGRSFLESLPVRHRRYRDREALLRDVSRFLYQGGA
jgi:predicted DnaQ family exonuclease/DinG family helicase